MDSELVRSALLNKVVKVAWFTISGFWHHSAIYFKLSVKYFLAGPYSWTCLLPRHYITCSDYHVALHTIHCDVFYSGTWLS